MPEESEKERNERELIELLNELRVVLPGVQVVFAFLLTLPFSSGFERVTSVQRGVYFGATMTTGMASIFLMAPTAYHRLRFRQSDKERMLRASNKLAIVGTLCLAVSIATVIFLITDVIFNSLAAGLAAAVVVGMLGWFWFGLPISRRVRDS